MADILKIKESMRISPNREAQKKIYRKVANYMNGDSEAHIDGIFEDHFENWSVAKKTILFEDVGFTDNVSRELAQVYHEPPKRKFMQNGKEYNVEGVIEYIDSIYKRWGNDSFQNIDQLTNAMSTISPKITYRSGQLDLDIITPDMYEVILNESDPVKIDAIIYEVSTYYDNSLNRKLKKFIYWSESEHGYLLAYDEPSKVKPTDYVITIVDDQLKPIDDDGDTRNPYEIMPFITLYSHKPINDYFVDKNARQFTNAEDVLLFKAAGVNKVVERQGFSLLYLKERQMKKEEKFVASAETIIKLKMGNVGEESEELGYISPDAAIIDINMDFEKTFYRQLRKFGIDEQDGNASANKSGVSIFLSDQSRNKIIERNISRYTAFEESLFNILKAVNNHHAKADQNLQMIPEDLEIMTEFRPVEMVLSQAEVIDMEQHELDNGLVSKEDLIRRRNPEWTDDQVKEYMAKIETEKPKPVFNEFEIDSEEE